MRTSCPRRCGVNGYSLVKPLHTGGSTQSFHNVGTQTTLLAGPDDALTYRSLCKSFITGQYFRSYRRELWHQRKQIQRKLRSHSQGPPARYKNGSDTNGTRWTRDNRNALFKVPSDIFTSDKINSYSSMQDFKAASEMTDKSNTLGFVFLALNAKDSRKLRTSEEERITLSSLSLPMNVERHEADPLQVESDSEGRNIRSPANPVLKSRLSVLSSLVSSSNDLIFRLSYYSNEDIHEADSPMQLRSLSGSGLDDEDVSNVTVPIILSIMIMTTYILIGAIVFCIWEDPNYLKWSYFCFVTLSTIGFGDIVPGTKIDSTNPQEKLIIITVYVAVGLSVFAMCFKLMQEEVVSKCKWLARYIGVLKRRVRKHRVERPQQLNSNSPQKGAFSNERLSLL